MSPGIVCMIPHQRSLHEEECAGQGWSQCGLKWEKTLWEQSWLCMTNCKYGAQPFVSFTSSHLNSNNPFESCRWQNNRCLKWSHPSSPRTTGHLPLCQIQPARLLNDRFMTSWFPRIEGTVVTFVRPWEVTQTYSRIKLHRTVLLMVSEVKMLIRKGCDGGICVTLSLFPLSHETRDRWG